MYTWIRPGNHINKDGEFISHLFHEIGTKPHALFEKSV